MNYFCEFIFTTMNIKTTQNHLLFIYSTNSN